MPKVVGLTGGVASGKSTASKFFSSLGVHIIDADLLSREIVAPGSDGLKEVIETFGDQYLSEDGTLNRAALGTFVFSNPDALAKLNAITHPRIFLRFCLHVQSQMNSEMPYLIYDSALLVETGQYRTLDALVVVDTPQALQVQRVMKRNGIGEADALQRVQSQLPLESKLAVADYRLLNDNDREAYQQRVLDLHKSLMDRFYCP